MKKRRKITGSIRSKERREEVAKYYGLQCQYCGVKLTLKSLEVDHDMPLSRGGTNELGNLIACCHSCNNRKGRRCWGEFLIWERVKRRDFAYEFARPVSPSPKRDWLLVYSDRKRKHLKAGWHDDEP